MLFASQQYDALSHMNFLTWEMSCSASKNVFTYKKLPYLQYQIILHSFFNRNITDTCFQSPVLQGKNLTGAQ